jgi:hypothetical protein
VDVSFATTGNDVIAPTNMVWIADPTQPGYRAVASRPIPETAKAGEFLGSRGEQLVRNTAALDVGRQRTHALSHQGRLVVVEGVSADSVDVAETLATAVDLDVSLTGLIAVLWGKQVSVYANPSSEPLWTLELEEDLLPAVAIAAGGTGELFVAGRGTVAVAAYALDTDGQFRRTRALRAADLELESPGGLEVTPFMLLPVPGREGWVGQDRFLLVSDTSTGVLVALERRDFQFVGRWNLREELPGVAPGRLDVSNRGQIAFVDVRSGAAYALPTRVTAGMVRSADFRWRVLDQPRVFRVQGGDTLSLPPRNGCSHTHPATPSFRPVSPRRVSPARRWRCSTENHSCCTFWNESRRPQSSTPCGWPPTIGGSLTSCARPVARRR